MRRWLALLTLLLVGYFAAPEAQTLSSQVLQLLARTNVWTGKQTFNDLRLPDASPGDTAARLYQIGGNLYWNGATVASSSGGPALHTLLSSTHSDSSAAAVARGALITGQGGTPAWTRLSVGAAGTVLRSDGTDVAWSTDGSGLASLNASQLASGTIPLARLSGITNTEIAGGASIAWTKLDKGGSSLADLTTRSAGDLTSGSLADARLSANVSLFGATVDNAEITDGTILFAKWASNGCSSGQYPQYNGSAWVCATVTPGAGTVTSVGLALPAIFSVTGSPVTGSGTLTGSLASQSANLVWAGPSTGAAASPTFRSLVYNDFPTSAAAAGTYPKVTINAQGIVTGTATQITLTTDVTGTLPLANGGTGLNAAADDSVLLSSGAAWAATALANCTTGLTYSTATNSFGCAASTAAHALLSASHSDTLAAAVVRGDLVVGSSVPQWTRLPIGPAYALLLSNGSDPAWDDTPTLTALEIFTANSIFNFNMVGGGYYSATRTAPGVGVSGYAAESQSTLVEAGSGTHLFLYGQEFNGTFTNNGASTTTTALVHIGPLLGSPPAGWYSLLVDGPIGASAGVYEYSRTTKMGDWNGVTYGAGNFTGSGALTWTVDSGDVAVNRYTDIGTTMLWSLGVVATSTGGTANTELRVTLPASRTVSATTTGTCAGLDNGTEVHSVWTATAGNTYVSFFRTISGANWSNASTNATALRCTITVAF